MVPKHRNRRLASITIGAVVLLSGVGLLASALTSYRQYFYEPSEVAAQSFVPGSDLIRVGGLVVPGSVEKSAGLTTRFSVVDFEDRSAQPLNVIYTGLLPDLFKEDSGVVITGALRDGEFVASELLAKHDENYTPQIG